MNGHAVPAPPFVADPHPKRVLIIGGGPAGLGVLRALLHQNPGEAPPPFEAVSLVERREDIGGVWNIDSKTVALERSYPNGHASGHWPVYANPQEAQQGRPHWPSPSYPLLRGNVLPSFLSYSTAGQFPAPSENEPFPSLDETQAYLVQAAKPVRAHIRCNIECVGVWELPGDKPDQNRWAVRLRDWNEGGKAVTEYWDAVSWPPRLSAFVCALLTRIFAACQVISATSFTDAPAYPAIPGIKEAHGIGKLQHCKWYRGVEGTYTADERILVVGNGNSANDVAAHLASQRVAGKHEPIYRAVRHAKLIIFSALEDERIKDVPTVKAFHVRERTGKAVLDVELIDTSIIENVDRVVLGSGYQYGRYPWIHLLSRGATSADEDHLPGHHDSADWQAPTGSDLWKPVSLAPRALGQGPEPDDPGRLVGLWEQMVHARAATLAFANLPITYTPFILADVQGHTLRSLWDASPSSLPPTLEARLQSERDRLAEIEARKKALPELEAAGEKAWRDKLEKNRAVDRGELPESERIPAFETVAPDHVTLLHFHILGDDGLPYANRLRKVALAGHPEWEQRLLDWNTIEEERKGMYAVKVESLKRARERRKIAGGVE